tara:strand:+ start:4205 stop:5128 length:924 start_codon:yes stop_codon:yes gene_type:complete
MELNKDLNKHCGLVSLIGKPNAGKSTLLNAILNKKLSIATRKPQTTQKKILGIKTQDNTQIIYLDTPGIHKKTKREINKYMNKTALDTLKDVDLILFLMESYKWSEDDDLVIEHLKSLSLKTPVYCIINKQDKLNNRSELLPIIEKAKDLYPFKEIIPISALKKSNINTLENLIIKEIETRTENLDYFYYPEEQYTDQRIEMLTAELIREQLLTSLGEELPYTTAVIISEFTKKEKLTHIEATIWVERAPQKAIVIGKAGHKLKNIGINARQEIEQLLDTKVCLKLWVKVKEKWSDDKNKLTSLGFY